MTAKDTAIMSLTLGICAMVLGLLGSWSVAGLALGGAGLFCGLHARRRAEDGAKLARAGIYLSSAALAVCAVFAVAFLVRLFH